MTRGPGAPQPFAHYDQRRYETLSVPDGYAIWSRCYGDLDARFDLDVLAASPLLRASLPGASVLDLACGNGRIGGWLREAGAARVVGVDVTRPMLAGARGRGVYASLLGADLARTPLGGGAFDGATCSMALCHVADLGAFFAEARRILRPGGWLAIVDFHPMFMMRGIPSHFDHPETGVPTAIENHVHPLRDFFQGAVHAGFVVREMEERFVDEEWATALPQYRRHLGWPITHAWVYEAT